MALPMPGGFAQKAYSSSYQLARDFMGSVGPFTLCVSIAAFLYPAAAQYGSDYISILKNTTTWANSLFVIAPYVVVSYTTGLLAHRFYFLIRAIIRKIPGLYRYGQMLGDVSCYESSSSAIDEMYQLHMSELPALSTRAQINLADKVKYLVFYLRLHDSTAYDHVCRDYNLVAMMRQLVTYSLIFLVISVANVMWLASGAFAIAFVVLLVASRGAAQSAVKSEYVHLMATTRWLQSQTGGEKE